MHLALVLTLAGYLVELLCFAADASIVTLIQHSFGHRQAAPDLFGSMQTIGGRAERLAQRTRREAAASTARQLAKPRDGHHH